uniref:BMA-SMG-9 n=1 Tax=Brugia malayi TaxID=6279 RepID=A0A7I4KNM7_BRUMA
MGDHSRSDLRSTREYFNSPRIARQENEVKRGRRIQHYIGSTGTREDKSRNATVTIMPRPTAILSKQEPTTFENAESSQKILSQAVPSSQEVIPSGITRPNSTSRLVRGSTKAVRSPSLRMDKTQTSRSAVAAAAAAAATSTVMEQSLGMMKAAVRLLSDTMDFTDVVADYLSTTNTNFTVIGIIGPQGSGKSTLLSMIAGNDHMDMYRHYAFRPASREAVECCRYQSQKISVYVTKSRMVLLDCQAIGSASILNHLLATSSLDGNRSGGVKAVDLCRGFTALSGEIESLHLTAFLLQVCHTVILSVDWFVDIDIIRHVRTAEMLRVTPTHYSPETMKYKPNRKINFVLAHQRAKSEDFQPRNVKNRAKILECLFNDSQLDIKGGISLGNLGCKPYGEIASDVNYILLSEMKPRPKTEASAPVSPYMTMDLTPLRAVIDYEEVVRPLRIRLLSLPKEPFILGNQPFTEIQWYEFATRTWRATYGSVEIAKYASAITKIFDE